MPRRLFREHLNASMLDEVKIMTEAHANALASFEWCGRSFLAHPSSDTLNELIIEEVSRSLNPESMKTTFKTIMRFDLKSPIVKIRASGSTFPSENLQPLLAVQLAAPEVAIFRLELPPEPKVSNWKRSVAPRAYLTEHLRFKSHVKSICWDERLSTVRHTQSLVILNLDGALSLWSGTNQSRLLRSEAAAKDVCPPLFFVRAEQSLSDISKIPEVGTTAETDNTLPNYGNRLCFSGHPSCVLIMTANRVDLVDFSKSASTQSTLLRFFKPMPASEGAYMRQKGQFENVVDDHSQFLEKYFPQMQGKASAKDKRRTKKEDPSLKTEDVKPAPAAPHDGRKRSTLKKKAPLAGDASSDDEEAFRTTAELRLSMEERGLETSDPMFRFYAPLMESFEAEFLALKAEGPTLRLAEHELLRDIAAHPTRPFVFAILTTMRVCIFDERSPDEPLCQWRHHLVKTRRSLFERRILFSPECPHSIQFVIPPVSLQDLGCLNGKSFVVVSNSLESEVFTIDHGPSAESIDTDYDRTADKNEDFEPLPTQEEMKRQCDTEMLKLMDTIVRDVTRPELARPSHSLPPKVLHVFLPPPSTVRLLGMAHGAFRNPIPALEQVDYLNSANIKREISNDHVNIATTGQIGLWSFAKGEKRLSLLLTRCDVRGNLYSQLHPLVVNEDDRDTISAMLEEHQTGATAESHSGSDSDSSSPRSRKSSRSGSDSDSNDSDSSKASDPRANQEDVDTSDSSSESDSSASSSSDSGEAPLRPFLLNQPDLTTFSARRYTRRRLPLIETWNDATAESWTLDAVHVGSAAYDYRPPLVPHYKFSKEAEEGRLEVLRSAEGDYDELEEMAKHYNHRDRLLSRAVRQRTNPFTGTLEPHHPALDEDSPVSAIINEEAPVMETDASESESTTDEDEDDDLQPGGSMASPSSKKRKREPKPKSNAARKRFKTMQPLPPDTLHLCQSQIDFVYENLAQVLDRPGPLADDLKPIALLTVFDVVPADLSSMERIFDRVKLFILLPLKGLRSTADIYRQLISYKAIHPFYFPIAFLRATLAHLVARGSLDYISLRGVQEGTSIYNNAATPISEEISAEQARRHELMQNDALSHFMTMYDELDTFAVCTAGHEDVNAEYILGQTKTPSWKPVPSTLEKTTLSATTWRFPRAKYPPPAPEMMPVKQEQEESPLFATQTFGPSQSVHFATQPIQSTAPTASQLDGVLREGSFWGSIPPQFAPMLANPALARASSSLFASQIPLAAFQAAPAPGNLDQSVNAMDSSVIDPTQELDAFASQRAFSTLLEANPFKERIKTQAELEVAVQEGLNTATDLATQQSQIWDLLQSQQVQEEAQLEYRLMREEAEKKKAELDKKKRRLTEPVEKTNAPGTKPQLMALLMRQWEDAYTESNHLATAAKARATLRNSFKSTARSNLAANLE